MPSWNFRLLAFFGVSTLAAGCVLGHLELEGKVCASAADCPPPFSCLRRADGERACYLGDAAPSSGIDVPTVTPDYCHDVKPILDSFCTGQCHSADSTGSGRTDFRLDYYELAGGVSGAKAKADTIRQRATVRRDMPPLGSPAPSDPQRQTLGNWAQGGAIECRPDGGT